MVRLFVGAVLSAAVLFAWGFVFWGLSGIMYQFIHPVADEDAVRKTLGESIPESGTYFVPFPDRDAVGGKNPEKAAVLRSLSQRGPLVEIIYRKEGVDPQDRYFYVSGYCHYLAASLVAGVLLILAQPGLQRYLARVLFVALLGAFACVAIAFAGPVWFHHPWPAVLYESGYNAVGWLLAGLVMGLVIRPPKATPAAKPAAPLLTVPLEPPAVPVSPPAAPPSP